MSSADSRPVSLEASLSRLLTLLLFLVLLLLLGIAAWIGRESAIQFALSRLHHDAEAIIGNLDVGGRRLAGDIQPIYRQPLSGHYYLVRFRDGTSIKSRSLWDEGLQVPERVSRLPRYWLMNGPRDQKLLVWQKSYEKNGETFTIAIAEDVAPLLAAIWRFVGIGVVASVAAVLLMLLLQRFIIRRAFTRLDRIGEEVREVRKGSREEVGTDVPAEVLPVVEEFNQLLHAWRQHQERSRNAVGNLAHALKTPLQVIMRFGEARNEPVILEQSRHMQHLIEQELKRARITGRAAVGRHFRPREDLGALAETLSTLYHQKALHIGLEVESPETLYLDQGDMLELVGNLLDNAAKWAEKEVRLHLDVDGNLAVVVEDDGPGIDPHRRKRLLDRGSRLDENRPGHGLGLAIVRDIVALYGGSLELDDSPSLGGLRVRVTLPLE